MQSMSSQAQPVVHQVLSFDERPHTRLGWWLVFAGFGGFLLWAALAPLDKGIPVSGNVVVAGSRQAVQHPNGGVVERILVRDGDHVRAGQVVVQVDATLARAQQESLQAQYTSALATEARLSAEHDGLEQPIFPEILLSRQDDPRVMASLELQRQLLSSRRQALRMELDAYAQTIAGTQAMLNGQRESMAQKSEQRRTLDEQLRGLRALAAEGYVPRNRLLEQERLAAQLGGAISEDIGNIGRMQREVLGLRLRSAQREEEYRKEVRQQLADARLSTEDLGNRLRSADFELANAQVRAPASGTVVGLSVFTEGGVIAARQQLMEIVPEGVPLLVDARAPVNLVDKLHPGLEVELMFVAFNQNSTPRVAGTVTLVSADSLIDEQTGQPYYQVRAQVSDEGMQQLAGEDIRPGMPVQAFVRTGERSMLSYLFKPLLDRLHMSLTEE